MEVQEGLVDMLLQFEGSSHGIEPAAPLSALWGLDVLENNPATALVLEFHELLGMLLLLIRLLQEVLVESSQGHIVTVEMEGHGHVGVGSVQFEVDLFVHTSLRLLVV